MTEKRIEQQESQAHDDDADNNSHPPSSIKENLLFFFFLADSVSNVSAKNNWVICCVGNDGVRVFLMDFPRPCRDKRRQQINKRSQREKKNNNLRLHSLPATSAVEKEKVQLWPVDIIQQMLCVSFSVLFCFLVPCLLRFYVHMLGRRSFAVLAPNRIRSRWKGNNENRQTFRGPDSVTNRRNEQTHMAKDI